MTTNPHELSDPDPVPPTASVPWTVRVVRRVETATALDRYEGPLRAVAGVLTAQGTARATLYGTWLGHALHPVLSDMPVGMWTSAVVLDLSRRPDAQPAARLLVGAGILAALPTAVTGVAEWGRTTPEQRRVGLVHAAGNVTALGLYGASFAARSSGRHRLGAALGLCGAAVVGAGAFLGGHMTVARKVGSRHPAFELTSEPAETG